MKKVQFSYLKYTGKNAFSRARLNDRKKNKLGQKMTFQGVRPPKKLIWEIIVALVCKLRGKSEKNRCTI